MSATVSAFGRGGITYVTGEGEGGTQRNEFEAAIKSVTSSTTVGAVFLYDTSQDSDSGKWRKKCKGLSWFDEASSTTRSARSEFPAMALIVADTSTIKIYDLDDPAMPEWLVVTEGSTNLFWGSAVPSASTALNGRIYVATDATTGLLTLDFASDLCYGMRAGTTGYQVGNISERNAGNAGVTGYFTSGIVNAAVNDVAATVLEGAEIGALGLPIPTVAVATDGGVSVIHPSGDVYDIAGTQTHNDFGKVFFTDDQKIGFSYEASGSTDRKAFAGIDSIPFADKAGTGIDWAAERFTSGNYAVTYGLPITSNSYTSTDAAISAVTPMSGDGLAIGYPDRLSIVKRNTGNDTEGAVAYITSIYNSGLMCGDIRFAGLANSRTVDRCVKGNHLALTGTVTEAAVATGSELNAYSGFASDGTIGLHRTNADIGTTLDFGTGDFSVSGWFKGTDGYGMFCTTKTSGSGTGILVACAGSDPYRYDMQIENGTVMTVNSSLITSNTWVQLVVCRRGTTFYLYENGREIVNQTSSTKNADASGDLVFGRRPWDSQQSYSGSLSLWRISATAPTPKQIADIYAAEKPLFAEDGAKCLLQGDNSIVQGLAYDKSTGILQATQVAGTTKASATMFRGLEVADTFLGNAHDSSWTYNSATLLAANGGVSTYYRSGGSLLCDLPSIDVRAELNEGESKIPDDGKFHFSGVTVNATPTIIGQIPMAENEQYFITAKVVGHRYGATATTSHRIVAEIKQGFGYVGGDTIREEFEASKLTEEENADLDVDLDTLSAPKTITVKVTGDDVYRMQWKASVEVQRISEKLYER